MNSALRERYRLVRNHALRLADWVRAPFDLGCRLYVGFAFLKSGLVKLSDWETTLQLFRYEYHVPLLPPTIAATCATTGEVVLPVLLALGFLSRFSALGLFVINGVAVISYADISDLGIRDHVLWGVLLTVTLLHGPGPLAIRSSHGPDR